MGELAAFEVSVLVRHISIAGTQLDINGLNPYRIEPPKSEKAKRLEAWHKNRAIGASARAAIAAIAAKTGQQ